MSTDRFQLLDPSLSKFSCASYQPKMMIWSKIFLAHYGSVSGKTNLYDNQEHAINFYHEYIAYMIIMKVECIQYLTYCIIELSLQTPSYADNYTFTIAQRSGSQFISCSYACFILCNKGWGCGSCEATASQR